MDIALTGPVPHLRAAAGGEVGGMLSAQRDQGGRQKRRGVIATAVVLGLVALILYLTFIGMQVL